MKCAIKIKLVPAGNDKDGVYREAKNEVAAFLTPNPDPANSTLKDWNRLLAGDTAGAPTQPAPAAQPATPQWGPSSPPAGGVGAGSVANPTQPPPGAGAQAGQPSTMKSPSDGGGKPSWL
jgi:hypothetical protein